MYVVLALTTGLLMGLAISNIARGKGYGPRFGWFLFGFLIWPVALIIVALLPNKTKRAVDAAMTAMRQRPPVEFAGTLVGDNGASGARAVLSMAAFDAALTLDNGERWEEKLARVVVEFRADGLLEVTFGPTMRLFRPDDAANVALVGGPLGVQRQCPDCSGLSPANYPVCAICTAPLAPLTTS